MGEESKFLNQAKRFMIKFEEKETQKQHRDTCVDTYQKNNDFYQKNKNNKLYSATENELLEKYNKLVNRFFYLLIVTISFVAIMILCKICL